MKSKWLIVQADPILGTPKEIVQVIESHPNHFVVKCPPFRAQDIAVVSRKSRRYAFPRGKV